MWLDCERVAVQRTQEVVREGAALTIVYRSLLLLLSTVRVACVSMAPPSAGACATVVSKRWRLRLNMSRLAH